MFTQLFLQVSTIAVVVLSVLVFVVMFSKVLYCYSVAYALEDKKLLDASAMADNVSGLENSAALTFYTSIIWVVLIIAYTDAFMFGHVMLCGSTTSWFVVIVILFGVTIKYFFFKSSARTSGVLFALFACYVIYLLCNVLWVINSMLALILVIDSLNLTLYTLFFISADSSNNLIAGLSTFFWTAFVSTIIFFGFIILFFATFSTLNTLIAAQTLTVILASGSHNFLKSTVFALFVLFACIKLGIAPFFHWKLQLLKSVAVPAACFYVVFYFSTVFLFIVKSMLCGALVFLASTGSSYFILIAAVITLYAFNNPNSTTAKFLTYSSAINGSLVVALSASAHFLL